MKHENFITEYCQILDQSHGQRPDLLWFSTWMASKAPYFNFAKNFESFWITAVVPKPLLFLKRLRQLLRLSVTLTSLILKTLILKVAYRNELKNLKGLKKINVVRTFLYFPESEARDPFWGDLLTFLEKQSVPLVTIFEPQFSIFKCKRSYRAERRNFPYQVFLSPLKLIKNYFKLVIEAFKNFQFLGNYLVHEQDLSVFLRDNYREELLSSAALTTLGFYDCFYKVIKDFDVQNFYITFENNPWEKMCYLARRELKKDFKIIGFQHTTIQPGAANYFLSEYESKNNFFPNEIMCVGEVTRQMLKSYPHYQGAKIEVGCALRNSANQALRSSNGPEHHKGPFRLLVALDGVKDAILLLQFVINFIEKFQSPMEIRIKEHPNMKLDSFYPSFSSLRVFSEGKIQRSVESLDKNLEWADALLYSGTTVSVEALALGKPLFQYNYSLFNVDPLFSYCDSKYNVLSLEDFDRALSRLKSMSEAERLSLAERGKSFAKEYFSPCTQDSIKRFSCT